MFDADTFQLHYPPLLQVVPAWISAHVSGPSLISHSTGFTKVLRDYCGRIDHILQPLAQNGSSSFHFLFICFTLLQSLTKNPKNSAEPEERLKNDNPRSLSSPFGFINPTCSPRKYHKKSCRRFSHTLSRKMPTILWHFLWYKQCADVTMCFYSDIS